MTDGERGAVDRAMSTNNHFGWSLSDTVDDPRLTGLANFRNAFLLQRREQRDELTASAVQDLSVSEETLLASASSSMPDRPVKPYYGRQPSVSQWSDSCFGSEYPSLTSTGSPEPESAAVMARTWIATSNANRSTGWMPAEAAGGSSRTSSSGPSSLSSTDCWKGSIHHAMAVMEHREEEISSLFDQLHEIEDDLASMNNQVGQVSHSLHMCSRERRTEPARLPSRPTPIYSSQSVSALNRQGSFPLIGHRHQHRTRSAAAGSSSSTSCRDLNTLTEDEMADIVHRLLTRICEFSLGRQEGRNDIPLIV